MNNNTQHNNSPTKKKQTEYKSTANIKTQSEDYFLKVKKPRESISEVKPIYNNTHQNFFKPNIDPNNSRAFTILNNGKREKQHFHIKPVNIVKDANEKINLKIIENYHRIFLRQKNHKYSNDYLNNIFKLLKRKDHKYSEKRFLVSSYEEMKKEEEKIYLTGILMSNRSKEKEEKPPSQNKANRKSGKRSLIQNLPIEDERKKNIIDFNTKYMTQEANALREKLKSRQSRADSTNKHFPAVTSNGENNILSKETNETETNKLTLKTATNFTKNLKNFNSDKKNNNNNNDLNSLNNEENNECLLHNDGDDKSIKKGLDVDFNDSGSTPELSEILDSENDLHLPESEIKKLIKKNLAKQYNFKQDEEVKNQLVQLKQKNKVKSIEDKIISKNGQNFNSNNNKNLNREVNKKYILEGNKNISSIYNQISNQNEKQEESPKRKKYIGELIGFNKDYEKNKFANNNNNSSNNKIKNKLYNLKIKTNANENFGKEETVEDNEISFSSDNSLIKQVTKLYQMRQKSNKTLIATASSKENHFNTIHGEGKFNTKGNLDDKGLGLESKLGRKAMLISEFKNSNFFHKFKLFEKNGFKKPKNNSRQNSNIRNSFYENLNSTNNNKNLGFNNNNNSNKKLNKNNNNTNHTNYKASQDKIFLTAKELKEKKLDELYVKNINYEKILKRNLDMMKNLFPDKKAEKQMKEFPNIQFAQNGFLKNFNEEYAKKSSRNSFLALESNNNTENLNIENTNYKRHNGEFNIQTETEGDQETVNVSTNERNGFRKNKKMDRIDRISNDLGDVNYRTGHKFGTPINNSHRKNTHNINNNSSVKLEDNYTIEVAEEENKEKKKFTLSPLNKIRKNNFRKFSEFESLNRNNDPVTYSQAISNILKGKNEIFDDQGGINIDFLRSLRKIDNNEEGRLFHKCYDTKNLEKFDKELLEKINQIRK